MRHTHRMGSDEADRKKARTQDAWWFVVLLACGAVLLLDVCQLLGQSLFLDS